MQVVHTVNLIEQRGWNVTICRLTVLVRLHGRVAPRSKWTLPTMHLLQAMVTAHVLKPIEKKSVPWLSKADSVMPWPGKLETFAASLARSIMKRSVQCLTMQSLLVISTNRGHYGC